MKKKINIKKIICVLANCILLFCISTVLGETPEPQPSKRKELSYHKPMCCERNKSDYWLPFCQPFNTKGTFSSSVVDVLESPTPKQAEKKYIREYKGMPSVSYSAEYTILHKQKLRDSLTYRQVDLTCIKKNSKPKYCCTAIFPKAFGKDTQGVDRAIFQNTGVQCDQGETLRVEWVKYSDENEKGMEGLEKMGMIIKGKVIVRQEVSKIRKLMVHGIGQ